MKLLKSEEKRKCEMGNCKNKASYVIKLERMGIKSVLFVCEHCLRDLYKLIGEDVAVFQLQLSLHQSRGGFSADADEQ
ncbi:MAG: hypothetical protein IKM16_01865, partial [Clostridia bacterium]|nr:hypothetical protein [Clostridia bacterium]